MKPFRWSSLTNRTAASGPAGTTADRQGSTIVVVIALLLALTFLGIVGYTIGTQEHSNAEYFADSAKHTGFGLSRDTLFDWGLRQIILGTRQLEEKQSVLHGGQTSLMATLFGNDLVPYNGYGTRLAYDQNGNIIVDQDHDGQDDQFPDGNNDGLSDLIEINRSPAAGQAGDSIIDQSPGNGYQAPDVGYTYWDNNNPFLAYINPNHVVDNTGNTAQVALSSFHRPQYLRSSGVDPSAWYSDPSTQRLVLRPHKEHRAVTESGRVTDIRRFVSDVHPDNTETGLAPFPFDNINDGIWAGIANEPNVSYDADPDNDGFNEAIWMDLGYPMQIRENDDGTITKFVPMFAVTIYDADALLNLNAHGNLAGVSAFDNPFGWRDPNGDGTLEFASRSNQGVSASEVNPQMGLTAQPGAGATDQHERFFGHTPANNVELSNMEWWFLAKGRADFDSTGSIQNLYQGRYGEISQLDDALNNSPGNVFSYPSAGQTFPAYPEPGVFDPSRQAHLAADDNFDPQLGGLYNGDGTYFPSNMLFPAWQQPLDLHGSGRFTVPQPRNDPQAGRQRLTERRGRHQWPAYMNYQMTDEVGLYADATTQFLLPGYSPRFNVDDPLETILEPDYARSELDAIFGPGENAALHLSQPDQDAVGISGRVRNLAPINFGGDDAAAAEYRRRTFTTISWDLKSFSTARYDDSSGLAAPDQFRGHETDGTYAAGTANIMRAELRSLLFEHNRKLSINHVLDRDGSGNLIFRPLTPHPTSNLGPERVNDLRTVGPNSRPNQIQNAADQEWFARRDRQKLCRDIYTLLYLYGGGQDGIDYAATSGAYPDNVNETQADQDGDGNFDPTDGIPDEPLRMAQFAVNLVDRLDPDDVITKFEFDADLSNGWNLDDDPYTDDNNVPERFVVYGVESHQLALNEGQVVLARQVRDASGVAPADHQGTEWDDTQNRDWTFLELENTSPKPIDFASQSWQIVVKPGLPIPGDPSRRVVVGDASDAENAVFGLERRLTFTAPNKNSFLLGTGGNSRMMIGTAGDVDNVDDDGTLRPSHVRVNVNFDNPNGDDGTFTRAVPRIPFDNPGTAHVRDLLKSITLYRVNEAPGNSNASRDGAMIPSDASEPSSTDLLRLEYPADPETGEPRYELIQEALDRPNNQIPVVFELRRRLNPTRTPPDPRDESQSNDNPWIVVDTLRVPLDIFTLEDTNEKYNKIQEQLTGKDPEDPNTSVIREKFASTERTQPLSQASTHNHFVDVSTMDFQRNTLGQINRDESNNIPTVYDQYQRHFNRDYGSAMELMAVPLYGPQETTLKLPASDTFDPSAAQPQYIIAAHKFQHPESPDDTRPELANRWYRLFEFVEVPDRAHRMTANGNPITHPAVIPVTDNLAAGNWPFRYRKPGRIQLNTLRHPEVLGGLLDDIEIMRWDANLSDRTDGNRAWWVQFVQARDGQDPVTGMSLPGLPSARPFRPFNYSAEGPGSIQSTLLRNLPADQGQTTPRTLFEVGDQGQTVDHSVKHRLLEKVTNNSTTRSNVFLIFMQVDFFEAAEVTDPGTGEKVVRVGAKLDDSPGYRGFFVVDRSRARYLINAGDLPQPFRDPVDGQDNKINYNFNPNWDFHQLIIHRQTIN